MSCSCTHNQTDKDSYEVLAKAASSIGHGLFLVPDPEKGVLEYRSVTVAKLTYGECVKRGSNCVAFKWIAYQIYSAENIESARAKCSGFCNFAGGRCDFGCICDPGNFCS
jgi:hypothetical protein